MLDTIFGLPFHPLVVHATVVVVPAAAVSVLLAGLWPRFRRWAGFLPLLLSVVGLVLVPLSTSSGESFERRVGHSALIEKHSQLADGLLPWMVALSVMAAAELVWQRRSTNKESRATPRWLPVVISVLAVVAALGTGGQVVRIGHSGAAAAWSDVMAKPASSPSAP